MHVAFSRNVECQVLKWRVKGVELGDAGRGWRDAAPYPRHRRSAPPAIFRIISLKLSQWTSEGVVHTRMMSMRTRSLYEVQYVRSWR